MMVVATAATAATANSDNLIFTFGGLIKFSGGVETFPEFE